MNTWGGLTTNGFSATPRSFTRNLGKLGLTAQQTVLVLAVLNYQWEDGKLAHPSYATLSEETGFPVRSLQRWVSELCGKGYLRVEQRGGCKTNTFDFSGLYAALERVVRGESPMEPDSFAAVHEPEPAPAPAKVAAPTPPAPAPVKENVHALYVVHSEAASAKWPTKFPRGVTYTGKDLGIAKSLIDNFGFANTAKVLRFVITHWEALSAQHRLTGYPNLSVLWGYRYTFYPQVLDDGGRGHQPASGSRYTGTAQSAAEELALLLDD